jgi:hypothetical protein
VTDKQTPAVRSSERIIAFMIAGIIGASLLCFAAFLIASLVGVRGEALSTGIWPAVVIFPLIGLPIGLVLIIVLLFTNLRRRAKEAPKPR